MAEEDYISGEEPPDHYFYQQQRSRAMGSFSGFVTEVKDNKRFKIDGNWYSSYNPAPFPVSVGDTISFDWVQKGEYRNIKGSVSKSASGAAPVAASGGGGGATSRDLTIIRQNALAHATALVVASGVTGDLYDAQDLVIDLAKKFAEYSATGKTEAEPVCVVRVEDPFA
jgi:hypothetical protein